jgi:HSP20 family molecular chaperone IbpA
MFALSRLTVAALILLPGLALAQDHYDAFGPGTAPMGPGPFGPMDPFDAIGAMGPMNSGFPGGGLRIRQSATDAAYLLDIQLNGIKPTEVKVEAKGSWILITRDSSAQTSQEETASDGRGWRRSFSYSSSKTSRRLRVPRDGDTSAMQRQDADDAVHIAIPRTKPQVGPR